MMKITFDLSSIDRNSFHNINATIPYFMLILCVSVAWDTFGLRCATLQACLSGARGRMISPRTAHKRLRAMPGLYSPLPSFTDLEE